MTFKKTNISLIYPYKRIQLTDKLIHWKQVSCSWLVKTNLKTRTHSHAKKKKKKRKSTWRQTWGYRVLRSTCVLPEHTDCRWGHRHSVWTEPVQGSRRTASTLCSLLDLVHGGTAERTTRFGWAPFSWIHHPQCPHRPEPGPKPKNERFMVMLILRNTVI